MSGDVVKARTLLENCAGPDQVKSIVNYVDARKDTCVHICAREGNDGVLQVLVDKGADLNKRDRTGRTPMHIACEHGHDHLVLMLLNCAQYGTGLDDCGRNAFHLACCATNPRILELLIERKRELLDSTDKHGRSGLFYAVCSTDTTGAAEKIVRKLVDLGANVNVHDNYRKTPLH